MSPRIAPDYAVIIPYDSSKLMILFILLILRITSSKIGWDPPTRPVLPPWGTTASFYPLQYLRIAATSSFDFGLSISLEFPLNFLVQSELYGSSSWASVITDLLSSTLSKKEMSLSPSNLNPEFL